MLRVSLDQMRSLLTCKWNRCRLYWMQVSQEKALWKTTGKIKACFLAAEQCLDILKLSCWKETWRIPFPLCSELIAMWWPVSHQHQCGNKSFTSCRNCINKVDHMEDRGSWICNRWVILATLQKLVGDSTLMHYCHYLPPYCNEMNFSSAFISLVTPISFRLLIKPS